MSPMRQLVHVALARHTAMIAVLAAGFSPGTGLSNPISDAHFSQPHLCSRLGLDWSTSAAEEPLKHLSFFFKERLRGPSPLASRVLVPIASALCF